MTAKNPSDQHARAIRLWLYAVAALVLAMVLVAMALAQTPLIHDNEIASVAYYVIDGLGWVLPAMPIVSWMSRRDQ